MSRVLPILAILVVVWASPGAAVAAPSSTNSDVILFMQCSGLTTQDGRQIFTDVEVSQEFGAFAGMAIWASDAEPFLDEPIIVSVDATATLSGDGSTLTATYELWSFDPTQEPPFGELIGTAELTAEFTAIGDPIPIDEHFKEGNRLFRTTGTRQALAVAGELVIPDDEVPAGEAIDLSGCFAEIADFTSFSNAPAQDPASFSFRNEGLNLSCQWELDDGTFVDLFAFADEFGTGSGLFIQQGETSVFGFDDQASVSDTAFAASYELRDDETGEVAGAAEGSATLDATGERVHFMDRFRGDTFKTIGELLSVDGSLEID
ncbi:MAG TPA: hypothetical protein VFY43_08295, partial [Candidatus Limnocylindria bacterium]|nr:hypothetical protein [Candidatus Limnocylindria bacterium]